MKSKNTIPARERKNGASREQWEKRKAAANTARPHQVTVTLTEPDGEVKYIGPTRDKSANWEAN
jgi:hypothetical protein